LACGWMREDKICSLPQFLATHSLTPLSSSSFHFSFFFLFSSPFSRTHQPPTFHFISSSFLSLFSPFLLDFSAHQPGRESERLR
jgi:hypothetical protein